MQRTWITDGLARLLNPTGQRLRSYRLTRWCIPVLVVLGWWGLAMACQPGQAQEHLPPQDKQAAKTPEQDDHTTPDQPDWKALGDGKSLEGWKITDVGGQGEVAVEDGVIALGMGATLTAITYTREFPKCDYEFQMEARRVDGVDFFGTVTFPVGDAFCSLVVGGWGGSVVGISCVNGADASENETTKYVRFKKGQWYRIRIAVRHDRIQAWIDDQLVVDLETTHRKLSTRVEVYRCQPLGVASWVTRSEIRHLQYRMLKPERPPIAKEPHAEEPKVAPEQPAVDAQKSDAGGVNA